MQFKQRLASLFSRIRISKGTVPVALFLAMLLTYGFFLPVLGFYWDDWPTIFIRHSGGSFLQYFGPTRPLAPIHDILFTSLLGTSPLAWQISSFLVRLGVVLSFWWCLRVVWPRAARQAFMAALLFAVYPVFFQWPLAVTYQSGFVEYAFYFISIALMILAIRHPRQFYLFTGLSLILGALQMLISEYYWGLELLRPVLIWIVLAEKADPNAKRLKRALLNWLPYLVVLCLVVLLRILAPALPGDDSMTTVLKSLLASPVAEIKHLLVVVIRDSLYTTINTWFQTIPLNTIDFASPLLLVSWGIAVLVAVLTCFYLLKARFDPSEGQEAESSRWARQAILLGLLSIFIGLLPIWVSGRQIIDLTYADRLAIPALVGASLLIIGLLEAVVSKWTYRIVILSVLIGLSAGSHFRDANDYRWEWTYQQRFAWQLYWRAPAVKPDTAFLSEQGIFRWVTKYSLSTAINSLYPVPQGATRLPYWAFELDNLGPTGDLIHGTVLADSVRSLSFSGPSSDSLIISYDPYLKQGPSLHCLWILGPNDSYAHAIGPLTRDTLPISNLSRILPTPVSSTYPDPGIFGPEPAHTWCYYFEKADLARQLGDWQTVASLGDEALSHSFTPNDPYEWIPFIEGYIHTGNWDQARTLSLATTKRNLELYPAVCDTWSRAAGTMDLSPSETTDLASIKNEFSCSSH